MVLATGEVVGVTNDVVEFLTSCVAFNKHLHADLLEAHLAGFTLGSIGAPGSGISDVAFQENFELGQLDVDTLLRP